MRTGVEMDGLIASDRSLSCELGTRRRLTLLGRGAGAGKCQEQRRMQMGRAEPEVDWRLFRWRLIC